ncbi:MAG: hypothetical protein H7Y22_00415 [Gemmatimonadaceae bacterium]|nr:hypothetical protein [Gloeobacterales cyanobacterium ES-bin-141]
MDKAPLTANVYSILPFHGLIDMNSHFQSLEVSTQGLTGALLERIARTSIVSAALLVLGVAGPQFTSAHAVTLVVGGQSDPWLAGMPNGSTASNGDVVPNQSPVLFSFVEQSVFTFAVTGSVGNAGAPSGVGPDGGAFTFHATGAENGISNVNAPVNSLVGVFLTDSRPDLSIAPSTLNFSANLNFETLLPQLQQVFFIGNGSTNGGVRQQFVAPDGATRLFLGTMDGFGWFNNVGSFSVELNTVAVPEPSPLVPLVLTGALLGTIRLKQALSS